MYHSERGFIQRDSHGRLRMKGASEGVDMLALCGGGVAMWYWGGCRCGQCRGLSRSSAVWTAPANQVQARAHWPDGWLAGLGGKEPEAKYAVARRSAFPGIDTVALAPRSCSAIARCVPRRRDGLAPSHHSYGLTWAARGWSKVPVAVHVQLLQRIAGETSICLSCCSLRLRERMQFSAGAVSRVCLLLTSGVCYPALLSRSSSLGSLFNN